MKAGINLNTTPTPAPEKIVYVHEKVPVPTPLSKVRKAAPFVSFAAGILVGIPIPLPF